MSIKLLLLRLDSFAREREIDVLAVLERARVVPFVTELVPCSIGSPFLLNFLKLLTSPLTKPKLTAIWIGFNVPVTNGKKMAETPETPMNRPPIHTLMAPEFSAENKS